MKTSTPFLLAILDGLGLNPNPEFNAFAMADAPFLKNLLKTAPNTTLTSFGERVGLPEGQMGNSEVGHLNIGAGRVVDQDLTVINRVSKNKTFHELPAFKKIVENLSSSSQALHLIGLTSPGGVHSDLNQLISLIESAVISKIKNIFLHIITDGRDRPQTSAIEDLTPLLSAISELSISNPETNIQVSSLIGRYYAMDRDNRWERTEKAYNLFTNGAENTKIDVNEALKSNYENNIFDEFINDISFSIKSERSGNILDGDAIIFYNFRADRMKQIVKTFIDKDFTSFTKTKSPELSAIVSMTEYDSSFGIDVLFPTNTIKMHFGEILEKYSYSQLRIAETEKYPHVTYFFNGGSEMQLKGEERILVPSPRDVPTYDFKPEMSAEILTEKLLERLDSSPLDVIILNFANCDMVGHTGKLDAAIRAVEIVDKCIEKIVHKIRSLGGAALITADHGNADQMIDYKTKEPHTYHTLHPVPLIYVGPNENLKLSSDGALCDIVPTALEILKLQQPVEMTGKSLIINS
jgi:2,3-bisphosphoglycerate-independent phosphoglycerate mutase